MNTNKVELTAAVIISFVLLGKYLEARAKQQTTAAIQALQALMPEVAQVKRAGKEKIIPISEIQLGDFIIVKPGEIIPVDGIVHEVGQVAKKMNISAKLIRHYESIDLIPKAKRTLSKYRIYTLSDIPMLTDK